MGVVKPRSRRVVYRGRDLAGSAPYKMARAGVGYVPEERRIFPNLSVLDNLSMGVKSAALAPASGSTGEPNQRRSVAQATASRYQGARAFRPGNLAKSRSVVIHSHPLSIASAANQASWTRLPDALVVRHRSSKIDQ